MVFLSRGKKPANFSSKVEPPLLRVALGNRESVTPTTVERKARVSIKRIIYNAHEEARRKLLLL